MKKVVTVLAALVVLLLSSCGGLGVVPTVVEADAVLALAGYEVMTAISPSVSVVTRGPAPIVVNRDYGGTATFAYTETGVATFYGDIAFDSYTIEDPDGNIYTVDGSIYLEIDAADGLSVTYSGSVTISKNGGSTSTYTVDVVYTITVGPEPPLTITVITAGEINGVVVDEEKVYTFETT